MLFAIDFGLRSCVALVVISLWGRKILPWGEEVFSLPLERTMSSWGVLIHSGVDTQDWPSVWIKEPAVFAPLVWQTRWWLHII